MKREKWNRLASVLAAAPTLPGAFGGGSTLPVKAEREEM